MQNKNGSDDVAFGLFLIFLFALFMVVLAIAVNNYSSPKYDKAPVAVKTNSIGCTKYRYKEDAYWKCPKGTGINSIEETRNTGKSVSHYTTPVVEEN